MMINKWHKANHCNRLRFKYTFVYVLKISADLEPNCTEMHVCEVNDKKTASDFLRVPLRIYADDPNWIRPLNRDINSIFEPQQNEAFQHGECARWVLYDAKGELAGRIAAFIDRNTAYANPQPTGGVGFFECIPDKQTAFLLFDTAKAWLEQRGMEAMDGPVNFGERDSWWGLLVDGFRDVPYKMNYNPSYYKDFFEAYGFRDYFRQYCFTMHIEDPVDPLFYRQHDIIAKDTSYKAVHIDKNRLDQFADDFCAIFNSAWEGHNKGRSVDSAYIRRLFRRMRPVIDENLIWYVYHNDKPVAFWVNLPDLNEAVRHFKGRFGWIQQLQLLAWIKFGKFRRINGFVFGVVPEHQCTGVVGFLIIEGALVMKKLGRYTEYEMQWQGDFNPRMLRIGRTLGKRNSRLLITYRYLFDPNQPFRRHPVLKAKDKEAGVAME